MTRLLVIDRDRELGHTMALTCMDEGVALRLAETVAEGVRAMLSEAVSAVLVDAGLIRLSAREQAQVFQEAAPGAPMVALVEPGQPDDERVRLEVAGFLVVAKPVVVREVLAKIEPRMQMRGRGSRAARRPSAA